MQQTVLIFVPELHKYKINPCCHLYLFLLIFNE